MNLHRFFFLGIVDGDGCFSMTLTKTGYYSRRFSVASSLLQDWTYFEDMLKSIGVAYKIERSETSTGSYSKLHILAVDDIERLGAFIYQSQSIDGIGLHRKYEVFELICSTGRRKTSKYKNVIKKKNGKWLAYGSQAGGMNPKYLGTFADEMEAAIAAGTFHCNPPTAAVSSVFLC